MSEGYDSAERILKYSRSFRPYPATVPDLELQETEQERIRRVLGQQGCTHDCNQGRNCTCTPKQEKPSLWKSWRWK